MMTPSASTASAASTPTEQLDRVPRLHFNNPKERSTHTQAFLAWLSSAEQGQGEEKEDVYAGLEVYGEYR